MTQSPSGLQSDPCGWRTFADETPIFGFPFWVYLERKSPGGPFGFLRIVTQDKHTGHWILFDPGGPCFFAFEPHPNDKWTYIMPPDF